MSILVIDVAAIPDVELGTKLYGLHDLSEKDITRVMYTKSREKDISPGNLQCHLQKILAISILFKDQETLKIIALGDPQSNEIDLLQQLQQEIERHKPVLITWDGSRSLLPLLQYRYFANCIQTPFKGSAGHTDIKNELSGGLAEVDMNLHEAVLLAGYPGKPLMTQEAILDAWLAGDIDQVRSDKLHSVVNTWLVYQRLQFIRGEIDQAAMKAEQQILYQELARSGILQLEQLMATGRIAAGVRAVD